MGEGGRYRRRLDGSAELMEAPTDEAGSANGPRLADGTIIGADGYPVQEPAPAAPAPGESGGEEEGD